MVCYNQFTAIELKDTVPLHVFMVTPIVNYIFSANSNEYINIKLILYTVSQ